MRRCGTTTTCVATANTPPDATTCDDATMLAKRKPAFVAGVMGAFGPRCSWPRVGMINGTDDARRSRFCAGDGVERSIGAYATWNACAMRPRPPAAARNELVEVTRLMYRDAPWAEGFSQHNDSGRADLLAYGCWFFVAPGSGIFLNVSRTFAIETRTELRRKWELPELNHKTGGDDAYICNAAHERGFKTVQISRRTSRGPWGHTEPHCTHTQWTLDSPSQCVQCANLIVSRTFGVRATGGDRPSSSCATRGACGSGRRGRARRRQRECGSGTGL